MDNMIVLSILSTHISNITEATQTLFEDSKHATDMNDILDPGGPKGAQNVTDIIYRRLKLSSACISWDNSNNICAT